MTALLSHSKFMSVLVSGIFAALFLHAPFVLAGERRDALPEIGLSVSFDMERKSMQGECAIKFYKEGEVPVQTGALELLSVRRDGVPLEPKIKDGAFRVKTERGTTVEIAYRCRSGQDSPCVIEERGIVLSGSWYPAPEGLEHYHLRALVPADFTAVSESEETTEAKTKGGNLFSFSFPHPVSGIDLVAARYNVKSESFRGIGLSTYFFPEDAGLAGTYLDYARKYIELYEGMAGKFPFGRFSIVENFLETGYSVPTFTVLGREVVRLPFIVKTSLGHEILHQWLGNLVYIDFEKGNWAEGLTTYLADHYYEEEKGRGWLYRKQILIDYDSYVLPGEDFPLRDFRTRTDFASRAIGYGKAAMVFHMLRKIVGDEAFFRSFRDFVDRNRFRKASWEDIRASFEKESGRDLGRFFKAWLEEKGAPRLGIKNIEIGPKGFRSTVSFDVVQEEKPFFIFDLPLTVKTAKGQTTGVLKVEAEEKAFAVTADAVPEKLAVDADYDVFRRLSESETPPVIGKILGDAKGVVSLPGEEQVPVYSGLTGFFSEKGYEVKKPSEVTTEEMSGGNVIALGRDNPLLKRLFGRVGLPEAGFVLAVKKNPLDLSRVVAVAEAASKGEVDAALPKIPHYGKYSMIAFKEGVNTEKETAESERGLTMTLRKAVPGVEVAKTLDLPEIVGKVAAKKIVYIGEVHDKYEDHVTELEAIRGLFAGNREIAVGMEMFQRPFQKALDDYIAGKTDEREFLKASEYFKRWGFDYNLYKDILRFAREEKIPVVALNINNEIVDKIFKSGIDSLTEEEKKALPEAMDMSDEQYRERLKAVFERHQGSAGKDFANFYQAQIVWDETMARSVDEYLRANPGRRMVVLAGAGHLIFGSGIPKRVFRRNGLDYSILINDESVEKGIADFVLFPPEMKTLRAPKLMAILKAEGGKVTITGFPEGSVSEKAGLTTGDVIVSLDGEKVGSVEDIRIFLFYKKQGDTIRVTVLRKRFLFGERELSVQVTLKDLH
ncbi:MAG: ChaN family lipoprotein [Nitrospirae bacterium]|nr:ChaN family lipoprotein [Nitrospirota bacterium]